MEQFEELLNEDFEEEDDQFRTYHRRARYQRNRREVTNENDYKDHFQRSQNRTQGRFKLKMDIPHFNRSLHIEDFLEWIVEVERFFDYMEIDENQQVKLVVIRFKGVASAWSEQTVINKRRLNQRPVHT